MGMPAPTADEAKQKAKEIQQKADVKSKEAEQHVRTTMKKTQESAVGKRIPTSIDSISFRDIVKANLLLNAMMTLGVYLIVHSYVKDQAAEYSFHRVILEFACWTLLIFGLGGIVSDFVFFFGHLFAFFRIFLLLKFLKLVGLAIFIVGMLVAEFGNYFVVCSQIVFTLSA